MCLIWPSYVNYLYHHLDLLISITFSLLCVWLLALRRFSHHVYKFFKGYISFICGAHLLHDVLQCVLAHRVWPAEGQHLLDLLHRYHTKSLLIKHPEGSHKVMLWYEVASFESCHGELRVIDWSAAIGITRVEYFNDFLITKRLATVLKVTLFYLFHV